MLDRAYRLRQAIKLFVASADELYGPITTIKKDGRLIKTIPWSAFQAEKQDWARVVDVKNILAVSSKQFVYGCQLMPNTKDSNSVLHCFSSEKHPSLWRVLPALERLQTLWENKRDDAKYARYSAALVDGLEKIRKYYIRLDDKPVYVLSLGAFASMSLGNVPLYYNAVLHPYYKLNYIEMAWGGAKEQAEEIENGNFNAKNWHEEAQKVVEATVSISSLLDVTRTH